MKKIKAGIAGLALMATLAGCGKAEVKQNTTEATTAAVTTEATTEVTTEAVTEEAISVEEQREYENELDARNFYNENTEFFSVFAQERLTEDKRTPEAVKDEVKDIIKVCKGQVADYTSSDIRDIKEDIAYILYPQDMVYSLSMLDQAQAYRNLGQEVTIEGSLAVCDIPKLSQFAQTEETKTKLETYETLYTKVNEDLKANNSISDETKAELTNAVIALEKSYRKDSNEMNESPIYESDKLLENLANESLVELTAYAVGPIIHDDELGDIQLIAATDEEKDILNKYNLAGEKVTAELEDKALEIKSKLAVTKYEEGVCAHTENLGKHADDNVDTYGKLEEIQEQMKYFEAMKEMLASAKYTEETSTYTI